VIATPLDTAVHDPASTPRAVGTRQELEIELHDDGEALQRILAVLHRRRCRVTHLEFSARDRHRPGRLVVHVVAPTAHAHCLGPWLDRLVGVTRVEALRLG
jgi:hypothetical protein